MTNTPYIALLDQLHPLSPVIIEAFEGIERGSWNLARALDPSLEYASVLRDGKAPSASVQVQAPRSG